MRVQGHARGYSSKICGIVLPRNNGRTACQRIFCQQAWRQKAYSHRICGNSRRHCAYPAARHRKRNRSLRDYYNGNWLRTDLPVVYSFRTRCFRDENSQSKIGLEMASACIGAAVIPPVFGIIANGAGLWVYPFYILTLALLTLFISEWLNKILAVKCAEND